MAKTKNNKIENVDTLDLVKEPVSIMVNTHGTGKVDEDKIVKAIRDIFDLTPKGIIQQLDLLKPIYKETASYGHFGRNGKNFTWEKTDKAEELKKSLL